MENVNYKILSGFAIILILLLSFSYTSPVHRWGDASTYYMQIDSITHDFDIKYDLRDIERVLGAGFDDAPAGLHLVKNSEGELYYGKEYTYALFASLFYRVLGINGILVFNAVMFFVMIVMGYFYLRFDNSRSISFSLASLFFLLSTSYVYIYWIHAEIYILFLIMSGFFLWSIYLRNNSEPRHLYFTNIKLLYVSAIIFGLATFAKTPNIVAILPLVICEIYFYRLKNALAVIGVFGTTTALFYLTYYLITGNINPYDLQYYYSDSTGYPLVGGQDYTCGYLIPIGESIFKLSIFSAVGFYTIVYNSFYYLFGRFTGVVWYYPFILLAGYCIISTVWRCLSFRNELSDIDIGRFGILVAIILNAFIYFYLSYDAPNLNYFGGGHAVGNRYFYIYPLFLFLIGKIEFNKRMLGIFSIIIIIAISFVSPLILMPIETSAAPMSHTNHPPFTFLPLEYTLIEDLPLWSPHSVEFNNTKFYFPQSNVMLVDSTLSIDHGYPELLFMSTKRSSIDICIVNPSGTKVVTLISGKTNNYVTLNASETKNIEVPVEPVFKFSEEKYLYKLEIYVNPIDSSDEHEQILISFSTLDTEKFSLIGGWYGREKWGDISTRWTSDDASILVYSNENCTANLNIEAISFYHPRTLEIYLNGISRAQTEISSEEFMIINTPITLNVGPNIIRFHVPEGCEKPHDMEELESDDRRCLSIAVQNITITSKTPFLHTSNPS